MRRIWPLFGSLTGLKSQVQKVFGEGETSKPEQDFIVHKEVMRDGSLVKHITMKAFHHGLSLPMGNAGTPAAIRIARVLSADGLEGEGFEGQYFLESGWIHIYPGTAPGKLFYSPHLLADYTARATSPAYLDYMDLPGPIFEVRPYTPWMDDTLVYKAGSLRQNDTLHNHYSHGGRTGVFTRCCLSSLLDTSAFLGVLESRGTFALSYFVHVDANLDYWFVKVTQTGAWIARILWHAVGDVLHTYLKRVKPSLTIHRTSAADKRYRALEAYLFATANNTTAFTQLAAFTIEGASVYYGWQANWDGTEATIVTSEQEGVVGTSLDGLRNRRYSLTVTTLSAVLTTPESELGTPGIEDITIYFPHAFSTPGRMEAWFPKSLTQTYNAELETDLPFHAWYKEDDTLCEVWFKHAIDGTLPHAASYLTYADALGDTCGSGTESFSLNALATIQAAGFYLKNSPGQAIDLYTDDVHAGTDIYDLTWSLGQGGGGQLCLDATKSGMDELELHSCNGGFTAANGSSKCCWGGGPPPEHRNVSITCGEAHWTRDYYAGRTQLLGSVMLFNFNNPASASLIKRFYESWSGHTTVTRNWTDQIVAWSEEGAGSDVNIYPWDCTFIGSLHPDLSPSLTRTCSGFGTVSCQIAGEDANSSTGKPGSGLQIDIEHYLVTEREVITVLDASYDSWIDAGFYEFVAEPTFAYPYMDFEVSAYVPMENIIYTGDFLSYPSVGALPVLTDMAISAEHLGLLTRPIGRV